MAINIPILTEFSDSGIKAAKAAFGNFKTAVADEVLAITTETGLMLIYGKPGLQ